MSMHTAAVTSRDSYWIHTIIYFLLTFGFRYVPFDGISSFGMSVMGVFIGLLYGWTFIGFIWPSMLSIFALGVCGFLKRLRLPLPAPSAIIW